MSTKLGEKIKKHWHQIYDKSYQDKYHIYADTPLGKELTRCRWDLVERHAKGHLRLLDWGCAVGAFHLNSPNGYVCMGYDINPTSGFTVKPSPTIQLDVMTFWDTIEHTPDFHRILAVYAPRFVFISTPNLECVRGDIREWKHYRPYEHIFYFDKYSLEFIMDNLGYDLVETNFEEGALRDPSCPEAILSAAFVRR